MLPQRRYHRLYKIPEECLVNAFVFAVLGISQIPALKGELHSEKIMISAFLARVMHGKQLGKLLVRCWIGPPSYRSFYACARCLFAAVLFGCFWGEVSATCSFWAATAWDYESHLLFKPCHSHKNAYKSLEPLCKSLRKFIYAEKVFIVLVVYLVYVRDVWWPGYNCNVKKVTSS